MMVCKLQEDTDLADKPFDLSNVRNRIVERRMMKPSELLPHPGQWRDHTQLQAEAMYGVLNELGVTDTLKAYVSQRAGGKLVTWDGHLRASLDPDAEWPVDVTDLTDEEADYALATHDPLGAMAQADKAALDALLAGIESKEVGVIAMFADMAAKIGLEFGGPPDVEFPEYDEHVADGIEVCICAACSNEHARKKK